MSMIKQANEGLQPLPSQIEGELRQLVRRGLSRPETDSETGDNGPSVNNLNLLIQRVSGASTLEIEKLITDLQAFRDHLENEAKRVQREITDYAQMSQAATKSTKIIAESLAHWKQTTDIGHRPRATR